MQLKPWGETSDREITLRGRRPARFCEFADRLLRDEVQLARLQRGVAQDSAELELRMRIQVAREGLYSSVQAVEA